jgi:hypothetical protein
MSTNTTKEEEINIAKTALKKAIETIDTTLIEEKRMELYSDEGMFARNRILLKLARLLQDELPETNF